MTLFTTILAGVSVFVLGQIFLKWIIEPVQELRKVISEILFYLANDYPTIHNAEILSKQDVLSTSQNFAHLGARLLASQQLIPIYEVTRKVCNLPKSEDIKQASKQLSLISKSVFGKEVDIHYKIDLYIIHACEALRLENPIQGGMTKKELIDGINELKNTTHS